MCCSYIVIMLSISLAVSLTYSITSQSTLLSVFVTIVLGKIPFDKWTIAPVKILWRCFVSKRFFLNNTSQEREAWYEQWLNNPLICTNFWERHNIRNNSNHKTQPYSKHYCETEHLQIIPSMTCDVLFSSNVRGGEVLPLDGVILSEVCWQSD